MRLVRTLRVVLAVLLLLASQGMAQSPDGGPGGGRRRGGRGGGDGSFPGGGSSGDSGRGPRGSRGFGSSDPNEAFNKFSGGKDTWKRSDITDSRQQGLFDRIAEQVGAKNGEITRDQFVSYMNKRQAERGGGTAPPAPVVMMAPGAAPPPAGAAPGMVIQDYSVSGAAGIDRSALYARAAESSFRRYDRNGDGVLSYDEMPDDLKAEKDRWDTDHNGVIDLNEYKAYYIAKREQRSADWNAARGSSGGARPGSQPVPPGSSRSGTTAKPLVYTTQNLPKDIPSWFRELDRDGDAQVGLYEWRAAGRSLAEFRKYDLNNDGYITVDEIMQYVAKSKPGGGATPAVASTTSPGSTGSPTSFSRPPVQGSFNRVSVSPPAFDPNRFRPPDGNGGGGRFRGPGRTPPGGG